MRSDLSLQRLSALSCFRRVQEHFDNSRRINGETLTPGIHNKGGDMNSTYNPGRVAGLWYLLLIAIGPFLLIYIPGKLYVKGNAAATINNIEAHELLFRFGILAELIVGVILVFLVLAFYQLSKRVHQYLAVLVLILVHVLHLIVLFVT